MTIDERLKRIADELRAGKQPERVSVRELLRWFYAERRGYRVVSWIDTLLGDAGIRTVPHFNSVWLDATIGFELIPVEPKSDAGDHPASIGTAENNVSADDPVPVTGEDPTFRIGKLAAANIPPLSVPLDCPLDKMITLLLLHELDWLVVKSGDRDLRGIVGWKSLGRQLALDQPCQLARDCMEDALVVDPSKSLFDALPTIVANGYVVVQDQTKTILGMVTTRDLSEQFKALSEPFLLLGEIENQVRTIISKAAFTKDELAAAKDPGDEGRKIEGVSDLSFGEYVRLIEDKDKWPRLGLAVDRTIIVRELEGIRKTRNDVMHFDPDPLGDDALGQLQKFARFLRQLADARSGGPRAAGQHSKSTPDGPGAPRAILVAPAREVALLSE